MSDEEDWIFLFVILQDIILLEIINLGILSYTGEGKHFHPFYPTFIPNANRIETHKGWPNLAYTYIYTHSVVKKREFNE